MNNIQQYRNWLMMRMDFIDAELKEINEKSAEDLSKKVRLRAQLSVFQSALLRFDDLFMGDQNGIDVAQEL